MDKCPNCDKELQHIKGRRKKKYCDDKCRSAHWQKTHKQSKEKKYKLVSLEDYNLLQEMAKFGEKYKNIIPKPEKMKGESGIDYSIRLAQWREQNK